MGMSAPIIAVHGGAGSRRATARQRACLVEALTAGYDRLRCGGHAVEAVVAAIHILEGSGLFNAGVGARLQLDGTRRMDASIMGGRNLQAGAVAAIRHVRYPIAAAHLVMQKTPHVLVVGDQATRLALQHGLQRQGPPTAAQRREASAAAQKQARGRRLLRALRALSTGQAAGLETVGAVALDQSGSVAAGASTGGIGIMWPGRVGDTPLIGCGVYADDEAGAVSMTGVGERIIRLGVAKEIIEALRTGTAVQAATRRVLARLKRRIGGTAGAIALAPDGTLAIRHTTPRMAAGYWRGSGPPRVDDRFR